MLNVFNILWFTILGSVHGIRINARATHVSDLPTGCESFVTDASNTTGEPLPECEVCLAGYFFYDDGVCKCK